MMVCSNFPHFHKNLITYLSHRYNYFFSLSLELTIYSFSAFGRSGFRCEIGCVLPPILEIYLVLPVSDLCHASIIASFWKKRKKKTSTQSSVSVQYLCDFAQHSHGPSVHFYRLTSKSQGVGYTANHLLFCQQ